MHSVRVFCEFLLAKTRPAPACSQIFNEGGGRCSDRQITLYIPITQYLTQQRPEHGYAIDARPERTCH